MNSITSDSQTSVPSQLGIEAGEWLLRLRDADPDSQDPHFDPAVRNEAFFDWLAQSPQHIRAFLEAYETYRRVGMLGPQAQVHISDLLQSHNAEVIRIYGTPGTAGEAADDAEPIAKPSPAPWRASRRKAFGVAAGVAVATAIAVLAVKPFNAQSYSTHIGEQRACKLEDGSMVYLNTESRLVINFSERSRSVRLVRGEALFVVAHEKGRPFIVTSGNAVVRALGTQFNIRARGDTVDVAVVEGAVQVTTMDKVGPALASRLSAGQEARVTGNKVTTKARAPIAEALSWRQRRLIFHDASLAEAAAEFNRYNVARVQVDSSVSTGKRLTGIFDADRPQALVLYAAQDESLLVEAVGRDWVIWAR